MCIPASKVGYTSATVGRGVREIKKGQVVTFGGGGEKKAPTELLIILVIFHVTVIFYFPVLGATTRRHPL
jgi:hypothetical protein